MADPTTPVRALYDGMRDRDPQAILAVLAPDFVGDVSPGMPLGVGGIHEGPEAMLQNVWGRVFGAYELQVEAEELLPAGDDRVVALGAYRGTERETGHEVDAAFAHVLTVRDGRITRLQQITDTARWTATA
jgi:ketosteroid isomerase-like protein